MKRYDTHGSVLELWRFGARRVRASLFHCQLDCQDFASKAIWYQSCRIGHSAASGQTTLAYVVLRSPCARAQRAFRVNFRIPHRWQVWNTVGFSEASLPTLEEVAMEKAVKTRLKSDKGPFKPIGLSPIHCDQFWTEYFP
ncbi:hypothetical protein C8R42DRAFT_39620 [Lentinula raphanica]|nr:hypothetical protein C8R42DRAFT_39620 [Lentinula raphanica]